jgi:hypothetical protein
MKINKILALPIAIALVAMGSIGSVSAQTAAPRVAIQLSAAGITSPLTASSTGAVMARLLLDTNGSGESVRINSLPFFLTLGNGAQASTLQNCQMYNESNTSASLSSGSTVAAGLNSLAFSSPLVLAPNTLTTIALKCDIAPNLVSGGTYTFSMNTANLAATGVTTGQPAIVSVRGAVIPPVVNPPVVNPPVTPGFPSTGAGGDTGSNLMIILGSLVVAGAGLAYSRKQLS